MSQITLYYTSVSSNLKLKKEQQRIMDILESKKIEFTKVDIAQTEADKQKMRELANNPAALPPQICNGDTYLGDYAAFDEAVEAEVLNTFLKL